MVRCVRTDMPSNVLTGNALESCLCRVYPKSPVHHGVYVQTFVLLGTSALSDRPNTRSVSSRLKAQIATTPTASAP
jgi:hypothetical protein